MGKPVACVVAYPWTTPTGEATTFDMDYYLANHMPLVERLWGPHGMKNWSIARFNDTSLGAAPAYIVQTTIHWADEADMKSALGAPETKETADDVPRFSNVFPAVWVCEVAGTGGS